MNDRARIAELQAEAAEAKEEARLSTIRWRNEKHERAREKQARYAASNAGLLEEVARLKAQRNEADDRAESLRAALLQAVEALEELQQANHFGMSVTGGWDDAATDPLYMQCVEAGRLGTKAIAAARKVLP